MTHQHSREEVLLKVENLSLAFGDKLIIRDINLEIKNVVRPGMAQGQVVSILGCSGIGKSKLAEIIAGVLVPSESTHITGNVYIGKDQKPARVGRIGVVQQRYPLLNHRTVLGNFEVVANNKYADKNVAKEKVEHMLEILGLSEHKKHYPANLSGGQCQRVAIGQALIAAEDFIIFDEPFSGLDVNMTSKVSSMIQQLTSVNEMLTVIIISHDISATCAISDTVWIMGREKDQDGKTIPGAKIIRELDLISRGLAWDPNVILRSEFTDLTREIKDIFRTFI